MFAGVVFEVEVTFSAPSAKKLKSDYRAGCEAQVKMNQPLGLQSLANELVSVLKKNHGTKPGGLFTPAGAAVVRIEHATLEKEVVRRLRSEKDSRSRQVLEKVLKSLKTSSKLLPSEPKDEAILKSTPKGKLYRNGRK